MSIITYKSFLDPHEANIALAKLKANDIPCFLTNEETTQLLWHMSMAMGGIRLMIHQSDVIKADQILEPEENSVEIIVNEKIKCPNCTSNNVKYGPNTKNKYGILGMLFSLIFLLPAPIVQYGFHCFNCEKEFKKN